jgi:hypothetical protein
MAPGCSGVILRHHDRARWNRLPEWTTFSRKEESPIDANLARNLHFPQSCTRGSIEGYGLDKSVTVTNGT